MALRLLFILFCLFFSCLKAGPAAGQDLSLSINAIRYQYLQAYCAYEKGDYSLATDLFAPLLESYPQMGDYVRYYLAASHLALYHYSAALEYWRELTAEYPHSRLARTARINQAEVLMRQEFYLSAAKIYRQVLIEGIDDEERLGEVYCRFGLALELLNLPQQAAAIYQHFWFHYPAHTAAEEIGRRLEILNKRYNWRLPITKEGLLWAKIQALQEAREYRTALEAIDRFAKQFPKSPIWYKVLLVKGQVLERLGDRKSAILEFKKLFTDYPRSDRATTALYYSGRAYWNLGLDKEAVKYLALLIKTYPHSTWLDEALYVLGRIHESNKAYTRALKTYQRLIRSYPRSTWADQAYWRSGWLHYRLQQYPRAVKSFNQGIQRNMESPWKEAAFYWKGRALENLGEIKSAFMTYRKLTDNADFTYYAFLARHRLQRISKEKFDPAALQNPQPPPWKLPQVPQSEPRLAFHMERTLELLHLPLSEDLRGQLDELAGYKIKDEDYWVFLNKAYQLAGDYPRAVRVMWTYLGLKGWGLQQLSPQMRSLLYPRCFWGAITKEARRNFLNPYLVAAIIRRESFFAAEAESRAGARGLMQIMPATGKKIASQLRENPFSPDKLYDPFLNVRFGSHYFAQLLKRFKGRLPLALAAYNGGEDNARRWWEQRDSDDLESLVENISFAETRHYIRNVISNYYNYLFLYKEPFDVLRSNY